MEEYIIFTLEQLLKKCKNHSKYLNLRLNSGELSIEQFEVCSEKINKNNEQIETFKTLIEKWKI